MPSCFRRESSRTSRLPRSTVSPTTEISEATSRFSKPKVNPPSLALRELSACLTRHGLFPWRFWRGSRVFSLVKESIRDAGLGSIILEDCFIRVIDFSSMEDLFEPAMRAFVASGQAETPAIPAEQLAIIAEVLRAMPRAIHAHFLTNSGFLWSSLQSSGLTIPVTDLTLKYGGTVSGQWRLLYLVDAWADSGNPPDVTLWSAGPFIDGIHTAMHGLRILMGRPQTWMGITPLMIFRDTAGWRSKTSAGQE